MAKQTKGNGKAKKTGKAASDKLLKSVRTEVSDNVLASARGGIRKAIVGKPIGK